MKSFLVTVYSKPYYNKNEDIELVVEFINKNKRAVYVSSDIAGAFKNEELKKEKDTNSRRNRFFKISPQTTVLKKVNLGKSFSETAGEKELTFALPQLEAHYRNKTGKRKISKLRLEPIRCVISVGSSAEKIKMLREAPDLEPDFFNRIQVTRVISLRNFTITGGSVAQRELLEETHNVGYELIEKAYRMPIENSIYQKWFGLAISERYETVKNTLSQIYHNYRNKHFNYEISETTEESIIAIYDYERFLITFYQNYWSRMIDGEDSLIGHLIHEHSHLSSCTIDHCYGYDQCLNIAKEHPDIAVRNADNYRLFTEAYQIL